VETEIIEPEPKLILTITSASDDPPLFSEEYQKVLRDFFDSLRAQGLEVSTPWVTHDAVGAGGGFRGEFVVAAAAAFGATINQVRKLIETLLDARDGRKLKLRIGSFRLEGSARDVDKMFERLVSSEQFQKLLVSEALKKKPCRLGSP
jgi:hypothetical protein